MHPMPATSSDVAGSASALLLTLSPGVVLLVLPGGLPGIDTGSLSLASAHGPVQPPMSLQSVPGAAPGFSLLLLRAQPGLAPGEWLEAADEAGGRLRLLPEAAAPDRAFVEMPPAAILRVLSFLTSRGRRLLRGTEDAAFAAACHAIAALAGSPERSARAVALCGADALLWSLPQGLAAEPATSHVVGRDRLSRVSHSGQALILGDCCFEGAYLLASGAEGPVCPAPAPERLPTLGELSRRQDPVGRRLYRLATAELARRAVTEEEARRLLRDHQLVQPAQPAAQLNRLEEPFGGALELAVDDHGGGLFLPAGCATRSGLSTSSPCRGGSASSGCRRSG